VRGERVPVAGLGQEAGLGGTGAADGATAG
jgi:hypothetical protein